MQTAVTRRTASGLLLDEDQSIEIDEALAMYTIAAARALGVENETGSLAQGKRADLVVLGADPRTTDPNRLAEIPVLETYVEGTPTLNSAA
jgi:predicted amidohydrolase YtcJ